MTTLFPVCRLQTEKILFLIPRVLKIRLTSRRVLFGFSLQMKAKERRVQCSASAARLALFSLLSRHKSKTQRDSFVAKCQDFILQNGQI